MRSSLSLLLTRRYPALYGSSDEREFAFAHDDGWFAILDALSETLVSNAESEGRSPQRVAQVKEKLGTLRFYFGHGEADGGAITMAEEMSGRLCEVTGRPGRLGSRAGWRATRAPGLDGIQFAEPFVNDDGRMGTPPLGFTSAEMRAWRADVLAAESRESVLGIPEGWLDLADGMLRRLSDHQAWSRLRPPETTIQVSRLSVGLTGSFEVEFSGGGAYAEGLVALSIALSRWINPVTGEARPTLDSEPSEPDR